MTSPRPHQGVSSSTASSDRTRRILITGGAGFIGSHLTARLRNDGHSVVIVDNLDRQVHGDDARSEDVIVADVRDTGALANAMAGVEVVYHLAADTGVGQSQYEIARYVGNNTFGFAVVLQSAIEARVDQIVLTSSRAIYGEGSYICSNCNRRFTGSNQRANAMDSGRWEVHCTCGAEAESIPMTESDAPAPTSVYGTTKLDQENLAAVVAATHHLPVSVLRLFNVYGPGQSLLNPYTGLLGAFARAALRDRPLELYEDGQMRRDFIFIDDVVDALCGVIGNESTYDGPTNVGTGDAVTVAELASGLLRAMGMDKPIETSGRYRVGDVRHTVADTIRMREVLAPSPVTSLAVGLAAYASWVHGHDEVSEPVRGERDHLHDQILRESRV